MALTVAICGDSAMWGQGLLREHTYAFLSSTEIARQLGEQLVILPGRGVEPLRGEARSGAKTLPFRPQPGDVGDAERFIENFPDFFQSAQEINDFRIGDDESPGAKLFGENPAPFPTVIEVVKRFATTGAGAAADLVLLDGGINDVDFEGVLDPTGPGLGRVKRSIKDAFNLRLGELLEEAREAFPNAVIVYVGYYSVFSPETDREEIKSFGKYQSGKSAFLIALNDLIQMDPGPGKIIWNAIGGQDLDELSKGAVRRSGIAAATAQFWIQNTIASVTQKVRGRGIVYAHPGLKDENAAWAPAPMVYERYRQPGEGGSEVSDEMLATRLANIPRQGSLPAYQVVIDAYAQLQAGAQRAMNALVDSATALLREPDLTPKMKDAAQELSAGFTLARADTLVRLVSLDLARIEHATFASFLHPNPRGARQFADSIVRVYRQQRSLSIREVTESVSAGSGIGKELRKHGVKTAGGLRQLGPIAKITSLAVQFEGLQDNHGGAQLLLNGRVVAGIGVSDKAAKKLFVAADVDVPIGEFNEVSVRAIIGPPGAQAPKADMTRVFINGRLHASVPANEVRDVGTKSVIWGSLPRAPRPPRRDGGGGGRRRTP
ncbi:hypothetical protein ACFQ58_08625 [Agromyces sp. NPDC056523]|uniref:hypothetical protein n=1 Tax=Agromyces sp. NPDC056523 TaxID=3345850 RepID=UPI00366B3987